jgi:hypothetical protein
MLRLLFSVVQVAPSFVDRQMPPSFPEYTVVGTCGSNASA